MRKCPNCFAEVPDYTVYCPRCYKKITGPAETAPKPAAAKPAAVPKAAPAVSGAKAPSPVRPAPPPHPRLQPRSLPPQNRRHPALPHP